RDECDLGTRQRHARESKERDLEAVANRDRNDRDAVDECEAVEAETRGEPELSPLHGEVLAHQRHLLHGVVARLRRDVERLQEGEDAEAREIGREDEAAVDAEAAADARDEDRWWSADRPADRAEREERCELALVIVRFAVATEHGQP